MKKELNMVINKSGVKIEEVSLFREMSKQFNNYPVSRSTYVEEIHGRKGWVQFASGYKTGGTATCELGDLLFLTYDKAVKELRICILQAKYRKGRYGKFLNFNADLFQWELLRDKPDISNKGRLIFPKNILNFRNDYQSISAYGIFYNDNISGDIDFLYTIPGHIGPRSYPKRTISKGNRAFRFSCPLGLGSPNLWCRKGYCHKEVISTCSMDVFEMGVLSCMIGAPVNLNINSWVMNLLRNVKDRADNPEIIEEIIKSYDSDIDLAYSNYLFDLIPPIIFVITDSKKYVKYMKELAITDNGYNLMQ